MSLPQFQGDDGPAVLFIGCLLVLVAVGVCAGMGIDWLAHPAHAAEHSWSAWIGHGVVAIIATLFGLGITARFGYEILCCLGERERAVEVRRRAEAEGGTLSEPDAEPGGLSEP